jgi:hypothetical protein
MTMAQEILIGPFSFTVIRILIAVGVTRIILRGERLAGGINGLDWLMGLWGLCALAISFSRSDIAAAFVYRTGLVYNTCGIYFLIRVFSESIDDLLILIRITAILLLPIAVEMIYEQIIGYNLFSALGGVPTFTVIRDGSFRSQGPFRHPILAGTVGAVCLPLMIGMWNQDRKSAYIGIFSCLIIVLSSGSSGPIASALAGILALIMWRYREIMRLFRYALVAGYIGLELIMEAPAYYIISKIPKISASTGWHRAELINSAIKHLDEWWLWGTEYTRHWMPTGVSWSPDHTDITNHYIQMGVIGGLPLMVTFILILAKAFAYVGQTIKEDSSQSLVVQFMVWSLGASLFSNVTTMISVSYFDQSFIFLYLTLAAIGSTWSVAKTVVSPVSDKYETAIASVHPRQ